MLAAHMTLHACTHHTHRHTGTHTIADVRQKCLGHRSRCWQRTWHCMHIQHTQAHRHTHNCSHTTKRSRSQLLAAHMTLHAHTTHTGTHSCWHTTKRSRSKLLAAHMTLHTHTIHTGTHNCSRTTKRSRSQLLAAHMTLHAQRHTQAYSWRATKRCLSQCCRQLMWCDMYT